MNRSVRAFGVRVGGALELQVANVDGQGIYRHSGLASCSDNQPAVLGDHVVVIAPESGLIERERPDAVGPDRAPGVEFGHDLVRGMDVRRGPEAGLGVVHELDLLSNLDLQPLGNEAVVRELHHP